MCELASVISEAEALLLARLGEDSNNDGDIAAQLDKLAEQRDVCPGHSCKSAPDTDPLFFESSDTRNTTDAGDPTTK